MRIGDRNYRTIWLAEDGAAVEVIDQTKLPHKFEISRLEKTADAAEAIRAMVVRGAPLIGVTAAYGMALAMRKGTSDAAVDRAFADLIETRPTAVNLRWALDDLRARLKAASPEQRREVAYRRAAQMADEDAETCHAIGRHGEVLIRASAEAKPGGEPVNILTHCNAGWLATVDWGTALAPIYLAHDSGIAVHVWVDETRPRNQGAALTAFELKSHGVPHTIIVDNVGGHLMQKGMVDMCITGTDRTSASGDVCNKIGTYLKALAAHDNDVPFYVALPHSTIDWSISDGFADFPIEERDASEVTRIVGRGEDGALHAVQLTPDGVVAANYAFDITPARLVTGLITERGVTEASSEGLRALYPEEADR